MIAGLLLGKVSFAGVRVNNEVTFLNWYTGFGACACTNLLACAILPGKHPPGADPDSGTDGVVKDTMPENEPLFGRWQVEELAGTLPHNFIGQRPFDRRDEIERCWVHAVGEPFVDIKHVAKENAVVVRLTRDEYAVTLDARQDRLIWRMQPASPHIVLPTYDAALAELRKVFLASLKLYGPYNRIGIGVSLSILSGTETDSVAELQHFLPFLQVKDMAFVDFVYRINRQSPAQQVRQVMVNRISHWHTAIVDDVTVTLQKENYDAATATAGTSTGFITKVNLDINNAPATAFMSASRAGLLFEEFIHNAAEIAHKGDAQ